MFTVVASYRQNVHAYPSGGGDYEVATTNLGPKAGLTVASALLVDYVLTVAVSISSGIENLGSAIPFVVEHKVLCAVAVIVLLTLMNLRGVKESGKLFAIPTYVFVARRLHHDRLGRLPAGSSSATPCTRPPPHYTIKAEHQGLAGFALVFLLLRAFSSGCAALTGVEAISNGVPAFRKPKTKNAATTLAADGRPGRHHVLRDHRPGPDHQGPHGREPGHRPAAATASASAPATSQNPVITQVAEAVFGKGSFLFVVLAAATALVLFLAANTAYNGFPLLGSILAQDRYLPRQLHTRGDRLAFSNGIVLLAGAAALLVVIYGADSTRLIQLYIVGVFVSFTLSQTGMVRHWNRLLRTETRPGQAPPHGPLARDQHLRRLLHRPGPGRRPRHQVHPRRLGRPARHGDLLRDDDRDPPALRPRRRGDRRAGRPVRRHACSPRACTPSCWSPRSTGRRCAPSPTPS